MKNVDQLLLLIIGHLQKLEKVEQNLRRSGLCFTEDLSDFGRDVGRVLEDVTDDRDSEFWMTLGYYNMLASKGEKITPAEILAAYKMDSVETIISKHFTK